MTENIKLFHKILILSYYRENFKNNSFMNLSQILGLSFQFLDELITNYIEEKLLRYNDQNLLIITQQGELFLKKNKAHNFSFREKKIIPNILVKKPISFDEIYIPKNFTKKI